MGNTSSTEEQNDVEKKQHFSRVCNIIPDIPSNTYLLWMNQDFNDIPPPFLDLRYSVDIAPFVFYKNPSILTSGVVCSYLYNLLYTKYNMQWMGNAEHLYFLSIISFYRLTPVEEKIVDNIIVPFTDLKSCYGLNSFENRLLYFSLERTLNILSERGIVEEKMSIPVFDIPPFFELKYYYVAKDENVMKMALLQNNLILANISIFSNLMNIYNGVIPLPQKEDSCIGMISVIIVGYRVDGSWIVRFPFGHRWGDNGYGYICKEYIERFNRDRWILVINSLKQIKNVDNINLREMFSVEEENTKPKIKTTLEPEQNDTQPTTTSKKKSTKTKIMGF